MPFPLTKHDLEDKIRALCKGKIPRTVDPARTAQKRLDMNGIIQVSLLKRLTEATEGVKRDAQVSMSFGLDEQRLVVISGKANVEVDLECQRCNEVFAHECDVQFTYTLFTVRKVKRKHRKSTIW